MSRPPRAVLAFYGVLACAVGVGTTGTAWAQTVATPPDASGPQTAIPAPRPPDTPADVPGGSARNGVVTPPVVGSNTPVIVPPVQGSMPVIRPPAQGNMPVIVPPGSGAAQPGTVAK